MGAKIPDVFLVDSIVMDFDPSPGVKWTEIKKVVLSLKEILDQLGLKSFIKSTGGKGVHVHIPIRPIYAWDVAKEVSKAFAKSLEEKWPKLVTAKLSKSARGRKIFVDYLRNARGATSVAPYSVRARPEAGVAMPLSWEEFLKSRSLVSVDIRKASKILKSSKADPWADYEKFKNQEISFISKV